MIFEPVHPFVPGGYQVKWATDRSEIAGAMALRREVFCAEQGLFEGADRDETDDVAQSIVALSSYVVATDAVVGTVRIHHEGDGVWWGSRLAVDRSHRRVGALGAALIRLAVSSAHAKGCTRFLANVQAQNGPMFEKLRWRALGQLDVRGHPHVRMEADLGFYPPYLTPEVGFLALTRRAA